MKMEGRRESSNVVDNRRKGKAVAAAGGGSVLVALLVYFLTGQAPTMNSQTQASALQQENTAQERVDPNYADGEFKNEDELKTFSSKILASTEDVWTKAFSELGQTYPAPKLLLFTDAVDSACGHASANSGPFYCSGDKMVYLDLNFLATMRKTLGAGGDFAYAYVIAHEVGHHVQNCFGDIQKYGIQEQQLKRSGNEAAANLISVQTELQADCYAGVWANREGKTYNSITDEDIAKGMNAAASVGDDSLGITRRENFGHGSAKMRMKWLKRGLNSGDIRQCNTRDMTLQQLENI